MAKLRDKLKRVKVGGQLQDVSSEELQNLSGAAGRAAPPTTPLEAGVIGADPDAAKMAGTGAQKTSALRQSIQGSERLEDVQRREQVRRGQTDEEKAQIERGGRLGQLGGLQSRVQNLASNLTQQAATSQGAEGQSLVLREDAADSVAPEQQANFEAALQQLNETPGDFELLKNINNMLGITDVDNMITADNLAERFLTTSEQASGLTADAFADQATVEDLDLTELGYEDPAELADLLGMTPEQLAGTNLNQIIREVEAQIEQEHTNTADLQQRASNPNLGPAERAEARKQLRDAGATGIRAAESDIDKMADQIANADTVTFGGEEMEIGELLEDEYLSGLTAQFLDPDADETFKDKLRESEPELVEWIENNKAMLDEAVGEIESGLGEFSELQYRNQENAETAVGSLSDDIMGQLFDDWDSLRTEAYNLKETPVLDILNNEQYSDPSAQANLYQGLQDVQNVSPELTKEMGQLNEAELRKLGVMAGEKSSKWSQYKDYMKDYTKIANIDPSSPEDVAEAIMGAGATPEEVQENFTESEIRERSGLFGSSPVDKYRDILDMDGDGVVDDPASVAQRLKEQFTADGKPIGLRDAIAKTPNSITADSAKLDNYNSNPGAHNVPFDKIKHAFTNDSVFDKEDAKVAASKMDQVEMEALYKSPVKGKMDRAGLTAVVTEYDKKFRDKLISETVDKGYDGYKNTISLGKKRWQDTTFEDVTQLNNLRDSLKVRIEQAKRSDNFLEEWSLKRALSKVPDAQAKWDRKLAHDADEARRRREEERKREREKLQKLVSWMGGAYTGTVYEGVKIKQNIDKAYRAWQSGDKEGAAELLGNAGPVDNWLARVGVEDRFGKDLGKAVGKASSLSKKVGGAVGGATGGGCFIAGTKFRLANGQVRRVELITPRDALFGGGQTFATACFIGEEMFEYNQVVVSGSHAVLEDNKWVRVRDSQQSIRRPDMDGKYVYVVWNQNHRMISDNGTVFSDYAEIDMPDDAIARLEELNSVATDETA